MGKIIGIDLGTTNSCVAIMELGEPVVIPNAEGSRTTPSVVAFNDRGERLVGQVAKRQAVTNAEKTFYAIKRLIGRKFDSAETQKSIELCAFKIVASKNNDAWLQSGDKLLSPPEVSGMILQRMKETAEDYLGDEVKDAVITVPAYFDDSQRQATKDAGRIAGLNIERIINEPTAAALAYGVDKKSVGTVAVFDLGGGTFDISILELSGDVFNVKATCGDTFLGGEDFDMRVVDWLVESFKSEHGADLRQDRMALQRLKEAAEKAKHELSSSTETDINLPFITADAGGPKHLNTKLTRAQLENLVSDLIDRLAAPCAMALKDAGLDPNKIDELILVGGMTRMPAVAERAAEIFKRKPASGVNPDEVVAIGAAIQGGILKGDVNEVLLLDVTPLSLGIETQGGVSTKLIEKNTTIPTQKSQAFSTTVDNQTMVRVHVLQGEREMAKDNKSLALFELVGIPPAPRGVPQIEVSFDIDSNGIVAVRARDLATQREQNVKITPTSGLTEDEIQRIITDAQTHATEDVRHRHVADARNELEGLLYSTERSFKELKDKLSEENREELEESINKARSVTDSDDLDAINEALALLTDVTHRIAEALYSSVSSS